MEKVDLILTALDITKLDLSKYIAKYGERCVIRANRLLLKNMRGSTSLSTVSARRSFWKSAISSYGSLFKSSYQQKHTPTVIDAERFKQLRAEIDKQLEGLQQYEHVYNCSLCGKVKFHSIAKHKYLEMVESVKRRSQRELVLDWGEQQKLLANRKINF